MRMAALTTLGDVVAGLERSFGPQSPALVPVLTRVALRTGVDLRAPRPDQDEDPALVARVLDVLTGMGLDGIALAGIGPDGARLEASA